MKKVLRSILFLSVVLADTLARAQSVGVSTANFSTMVTLATGGTATMGSVVASIPAGQSYGLYLIRIIGPSLREFGVANPVQQPGFTVFNAQGVAVLGTIPSVGFPVTIVTTLPVAGNPPDWNAIFASVGAFGLISGAQDAYAVLQAKPGSYTVQVTDYSGKGGQVLIEVYVSPNYVLLGG